MCSKQSFQQIYELRNRFLKHIDLPKSDFKFRNFELLVGHNCVFKQFIATPVRAENNFALIVGA